MATQVTHDIRITVRAEFVADQSDPKLGRYLYSYRIRIENRSARTVQLTRRSWHIIDSLGDPRHVEGPGVVGETPVLEPGGSFSYNSFCDLRSGFGHMEGSYTMRHLDDESTFEVLIPGFDLLYPWSAN
jgi:ApaG protein